MAASSLRRLAVVGFFFRVSTALAWMLLRRGESGDSDRAHRLLREAIDQYDVLGIPVHRAIAHEMLTSTGAAAAAPAHPDNLTDSEMQVLLLVAQNLRNKDIADALTISPATVTRHVSNILNKTSLSRRGELVAYGYGWGSTNWTQKRARGSGHQHDVLIVCGPSMARRSRTWNA